jgi:hypothetical protein
MRLDSPSLAYEYPLRSNRKFQTEQFYFSLAFNTLIRIEAIFCDVFGDETGIEAGYYELKSLEKMG